MTAVPKLNNYPIFLPPDADYGRQTVEVPGTDKAGETAVFRNSQHALVTLDTPGAFTNCVDIFEEGFRRSKGGPFLGHRPILSKKPLTYADHHVWQSWPDVDARRRAVGSAVHKLFETRVLGGGDLDTVGIWSKNSPNWLLIDLAMQAYRKVGVPLYDTLGADSVEYVINHAELSIVFAAMEHIPFLFKIAPKLPTLKMIVAMDDLEGEEKRVLSAWADSLGLKFMDMPELEAFGRANLVDVIRPASPHEIVTICYTSGTSGTPKGVLLSHGNMAIAVYAFMHFTTIEEGKVAMSFLPLAHIFERTMELGIVALGYSIGYTTGDPTRFLEDIQILKPHFVSLVPRVLNRLYQAMIAAADAPGVKGALFRRAVAAKLARLRTTGIQTHALWDALVFRKVAALLGGRLTKIGCGSAPFSRDVADFLKVATGADIAEGYGMTETCGACSTAWPFDAGAGGTVGGLVPTVEVKLVDVPGLGYRVTDKPFPRGELLFRGANRFVAYYKDEEKTKEAIDADGWLHTGDVATLDGAGRFRIVDRVKNIMKLAQGEYVALEHVENVYSACPLVAQLFVHGDALQSFLVGVLVPDPAQLAALAARVRGPGAQRVDPADGGALAECVRDPGVVRAVLAELDRDENVRKLKGFEKVKRIHLTLDAFTVDNGCLTPTLKVRRKETLERYREHIDALYAAPEPSSSSSLSSVKL